MTRWPSTKANRVLVFLNRIGWGIKRQSGTFIIVFLCAREGRILFLLSTARKKSGLKHYRVLVKRQGTMRRRVMKSYNKIIFLTDYRSGEDK